MYCPWTPVLGLNANAGINKHDWHFHAKSSSILLCRSTTDKIDKVSATQTICPTRNVSQAFKSQNRRFGFESRRKFGTSRNLAMPSLSG
jgi:hypothetical protein